MAFGPNTVIEVSVDWLVPSIPQRVREEQSARDRANTQTTNRKERKSTTGKQRVRRGGRAESYKCIAKIEGRLSPKICNDAVNSRLQLWTTNCSYWIHSKPIQIVIIIKTV